MADFLLLGAMEWRATSGAVDLGTPKQRIVLATLLVHSGHAVSLETLTGNVWDDDPPAEARNVLYAHLTRIRRLLARVDAGHPRPARLLRRAGGYVLEADPDRVDLARFRRLVDLARAAGPDADRARALRDALDLWRGPALADLSGAWAERTRQVWTHWYLDTVTAWAQAELRQGNGAALIGRLTDLVAEHPEAESLTEVLMRALCAVGRSADALECYTRLQQRLADSLGVDPAPELRGLRQRILRDELDPVPSTVEVPGRRVPAQLPLAASGFAGRWAELIRLDVAMAGSERANGSATVCVLSGTAGVGKTALAVHWAHRVADRFPDGQLYLNLRGFHPSGDPMGPAEALRLLLQALGVPVDRQPSDVDALAGLYRSQMSGRRLLVLLDNARDAEQVRPLLPAGQGCLAVVTSRDQMGGLVTAQGARSIPVELPTATDARQLLTSRLTVDRTADQPAAADEIVERCCRLPLALAIVAARAAIRPNFPLTDLARELRDASGLDAFAGKDEETDLRAVFHASYRTLRPIAARLFRLLGLHPGPDFTVRVAASLIGAALRPARPAVAELVGAQLVSEPAPGRYTLHPLLRAYAAELVSDVDSEAERRDARRRMVAHYSYTAQRAARLLEPDWERPVLPPPEAGVLPEELTDPQQALVWRTVEHAVLAAFDRRPTGEPVHNGQPA